MIKNNSVETDKKITGEREFEVLVKLNMKRAYFTALGILGSHDAAMEVSQQAFIKAYKHFDKFKRDKKFFTWYYKILRNLCLNFIRNKKRKKEISFLEYNENENANTAETEVEKEEMVKNLEEAINELEISDREILIMREFEGLSYKEIAEITGLASGTVMSKLFYARKKLAEIMKRKMR